MRPGTRFHGCDSRRTSALGTRGELPPASVKSGRHVRGKLESPGFEPLETNDQKDSGVSAQITRGTAVRPFVERSGIAAQLIGSRKTGPLFRSGTASFRTKSTVSTVGLARPRRLPARARPSSRSAFARRTRGSSSSRAMSIGSVPRPWAPNKRVWPHLTASSSASSSRSERPAGAGLSECAPTARAQADAPASSAPAAWQMDWRARRTWPCSRTFS